MGRVVYGARVSRRTSDFDLTSAIADHGFTPGGRDVPALLDLLASGPPEVRDHAERALRRVGAAAVPVAMERAKSATPEARGRFVALAGRIAGAESPPELRAFLLEALRDPEASVRRRAAAGLGRALAPDVSVQTALAEVATSEPDPGARAAIVEALGKLGGAAAEKTLAALEAAGATGDVKTAAALRKARVRAARAAAREEGSRVDVTRAPDAPIRVWLDTRRGMLPILMEEAAALHPRMEHRLDGSTVAAVELQGPLATLFAARTWISVALPGGVEKLSPAGSRAHAAQAQKEAPATARTAATKYASRAERAAATRQATRAEQAAATKHAQPAARSTGSVKSGQGAAGSVEESAGPAPSPGDALIAAVARAIAHGPARAAITALTQGPVRYRLAFAGGGKRRASVFAIAEAVAALDPLLVNDPSDATWQIEVRERGDRVAVEWAPSLEDPRFAYRGGDVPAASHPAIAAALAYLAGAKPDDVVWDPFVGSGLELCERSLRGPYALLVGTDLDPAALEIARKNLEACGADRFDLRTHDAELGAPRGVRPTLVITNPPMGRRVHRSADLRTFLGSFVTATARSLAPRGRFVWVSPFAADTRAAAEAAGLHILRGHIVDMGGFDAEIQVWTKEG